MPSHCLPPTAQVADVHLFVQDEDMAEAQAGPSMASENQQQQSVDSRGAMAGAVEAGLHAQALEGECALCGSGNEAEPLGLVVSSSCLTHVFSVSVASQSGCACDCCLDPVHVATPTCMCLKFVSLCSRKICRVIEHNMPCIRVVAHAQFGHQCSPSSH